MAIELSTEMVEVKVGDIIIAKDCDDYRDKRRIVFRTRPFLQTAVLFEPSANTPNYRLGLPGTIDEENEPVQIAVIGHVSPQEMLGFVGCTAHPELRQDFKDFFMNYIDEQVQAGPVVRPALQAGQTLPLEQVA